MLFSQLDTDLDLVRQVLRRARDELVGCAATARSLVGDMNWQADAFREAHARMEDVARALDRVAAGVDDASLDLIADLIRRAELQRSLWPAP